MGSQALVQQLYALELDGKIAGRLFGFSGGGMVADVIRESSVSGNFNKKHIGQVHFQDMVLSCGVGMSQTFYDWLENGISGKPTRKSGAIIALNMANKPAGRLEFKNALVKSVVLPKLDAKSSDNAVMTVTMSPEIARSTDASTSPKLGIYASSHPKPWRSSGFKLSISGLEKDCAHVLQVDSIGINEKIKPDTDGSAKYQQLVPGSVDYPNIIFTIPDNYAKEIRDWANDAMIKGDSSSLNNKSGSLNFLAPSSSKAYFELDFDGLGIYSFAMDQGGIAGSTGLPATVKLYCSGMKFSATSAAVM